jgi:hypothetical protein
VKVRFIGDVHAKFMHYKTMLDPNIFSIQVGDFGLGFGIDAPKVENNHRFIRGNHDNPELCLVNENWIGDGTYINGIFCVGGARSTDAWNRTEGVDWWRDEEVSYEIASRIFDQYLELKPDVVVSHDCPDDGLPFPEYRFPSITSNLLNSMLESHRPKLWVFGHHHMSIDVIVDGTRFVCVDKNSFKDIEIDIQ